MRAYSYRVTSSPAEQPVDLDLFKSHVNVRHSLQDTLLQLYLDAAISCAEEYTKRDLIYRQYETKRDFFPSRLNHEGYYALGLAPFDPIQCGGGNLGFEIRKSPLVSVESILYINNQSQSVTVDPSVYYNTIETDYSEVLTNYNDDWPTDALPRLQSITINFTCGLYPDASSVEAKWKSAILNHAANLYRNRGDCSNDKKNLELLPLPVKQFYLKQRVLST